MSVQSNEGEASDPVPTIEELTERIAVSKRKLSLIHNAQPVFDPMVLAASIDAIARIVIRAGLTTEDEIKRIGLEAQVTIIDSILDAAQGAKVAPRPRLVS